MAAPRLARLRRMLFGTSTYGRFGPFRWRTPRYDYAAEVGDPMESSTVAATLGWVGRTFPEAPPMVYPRSSQSGRPVPVERHPMLDLLERPNEYYTGPLLWMATVIDWLANGDGYWLKVRSRARLPVELWWAPSWQIEPMNADDSGSSFITHYDYKVDGKVVALDPRDVVHFRYGLNPDNPRKGMTPLAPVLREIFTDDEAAAFTAALLRNFGVPGVIVSPDSDEEIDDTDAKETKKYLKGQFTGERRGEPLVMTSRTKVAQFGFSPEQLNLKELRRIPEERVTALIGIAAVVVGLGAGLDRSTFTNMGEAREASYEAGLIPMQRILAEDVRFQLLADFANPFRWNFGFDLSKVRVLQPDEYRMAQKYDLAIRGGWAQVAEGREAMGWAVTDADRIYLRPANIVEVPAAGGAPRALAPASLNGSNGAAAESNGTVAVESSSVIAREVADELDRRALTAGDVGRSR